VRKILKRINVLVDDPGSAACKKLSNQAPYQVRQGVYRIIYDIIDDQLIIHIIKVGHRSNAYR
jgi:mRNA interferase RelE/StbE